MQARNIPCSRRGGENHTAQESCLKDATCHYAARKGTFLGPAALTTEDRKECQAQGERLPTVRSGCSWNQRQVVQKRVETLTPVYYSADIGISNQTGHPITVDVQANGKLLTMQLDTGAAVSVISEDAQRRMFPNTSHLCGP